MNYCLFKPVEMNEIYKLLSKLGFKKKLAIPEDLLMRFVRPINEDEIDLGGSQTIDQYSNNGDELAPMNAATIREIFESDDKK